MAKNNLFLGMASGSVGDVTFYRRGGAQISRARNRNPRNPQTTAQATQRAFFAPVARFFAPLATVLETSFEGLSRSASYSKFLSDNVKAARTNGWYVPKGAPFWPLPYTLSKGTIKSTTIAWENDSVKIIDDATQESYGAPQGSVAHLSRAMVRLGWQNGDQVTIISVHPDGVGGYYPAWFRFNLDVDDFRQAPDVLNNSATYIVWDAGDWYLRDLDDENPSMVAAAVIVSRYENGIWRRSTQSLILNDGMADTFTGAAAIERAINSYKASGGVPVSDVYLNGGTAQGSGVRYVGNIDVDGTVAGFTPSYLNAIGSAAFPINAEGQTAQLLTVSGSSVADGTIIENAAVLVGISVVGDVVTGQFVGVNATASGVTYQPVAVSGRALVAAIKPSISAENDDDQFHVNTRKYLIAQGIPESALTFQ